MILQMLMRRILVGKNENNNDNVEGSRNDDVAVEKTSDAT